MVNLQSTCICSLWPELTQLTRWVAASGGCTGTPSLPFFPLEPQTLGWKRKHESKLHFIKTKSSGAGERNDFVVLSIVL